VKGFAVRNDPVEVEDDGTDHRVAVSVGFFIRSPA
jgi:hypothetical protein